MPAKKKYQDVSIGLVEKDRKRLHDLAKAKNKTRTEVARDAVRWYLDHHEKLESEQRESQLTQTVKGCFERAIAILAKQNVEIGTLYELAWQNHQLTGDDERFIAVVNNVKQRLRKKLVDDERKIAEGMKRKISNNPN